MALTKYFVILFLVYLNFDISPLHSAVIPEKLESPDSINDNDDPAYFEHYSTTAATEDDIGKIFESYENQYIKNSNWVNDDEQVKNEKAAATKPEDESTARDLETTEPTADDVVESIHSIIDEKMDAKKNRTDRTIVVVVTTNVFNINGSDESNKRQHTLLSFGTPGMIQKEASTDPTLAMHNKITTEFFNSNVAPIAEQSGALPTNDNEKSVKEEAETIAADDSFGDSDNKLPVTEEEEEKELPNVSTTEQPSKENDHDQEEINSFDIRQLHDPANIHSSNLNTVSEGRSFDDDLTNDNSNDILRVMRIIPGRRNDEEPSPGLPSEPFEVEDQEPKDTSLMEAMENILDTDVRKAFERDIPQTHHVPLDINIEEEALYAPLKDLSEYIVEEVPINGNYDILKDLFKADDDTETLKKEQEIGSFGKMKENLRLDNQAEAEKEQTITTTTEHPTTTTTTTTMTEERVLSHKTTEELKTTDEAEKTSTTEAETTSAANEFTSNAENEQINGGETIAALSNDFTTGSSTYNTHEDEEQSTDKLEQETPEQEKIQPRSELQDSSDHEEVFAKVVQTEGTEQIEENQTEETEQIEENQTEETEQTEENQTENLEEIPDTTNISANQQNEFVPESQLSTEPERQLRKTVNDRIESYAEAFAKLDDYSFDRYVQPDTTTRTPDYVTNPNMYIGASLTQDQVTAMYERTELARLVSDGEELSTLPETVTPVFNFVSTPYSHIDSVLSNGEGTALQTLKDKLDEAVRQAVVIREAVSHFDIHKTHFIEVLGATTTKPSDENVVSEVVKIDEQTTEQHLIIKKPGVDEEEVELTSIKVLNVETNDVLATKTMSFQGRSFSDNSDPVDPLRTLVEGVELTADITKTVDNFQSFVDPNDSIHFAANQVIENKDNVGVVKDVDKLNSAEVSRWYAVTYVYVAGGIVSSVLLLVLFVMSYIRFRQFKRNILFTC